MLGGSAEPPNTVPIGRSTDSTHADVSTENLRLRDSKIGWLLRELWVAGELLEGPENLEWGLRCARA